MLSGAAGEDWARGGVFTLTLHRPESDLSGKRRRFTWCKGKREELGFRPFATHSRRSSAQCAALFGGVAEDGSSGIGWNPTFPEHENVNTGARPPTHMLARVQATHTRCALESSHLRSELTFVSFSDTSGGVSVAAGRSCKEAACKENGVCAAFETHSGRFLTLAGALFRCEDVPRVRRWENGFQLFGGRETVFGDGAPNNENPPSRCCW